MTFRLFYIYFLQISLLICLTKADERDHYEEDSEFADDMIEDIDLREEVDSIPEWGIPHENDRNALRELMDFFYGTSELKERNRDEMRIMKKIKVNALHKSKENYFHDTTVSRGSTTYFPWKADFQYGYKKNTHRQFDQESFNRTRCPDSFSLSASSVVLVKCGSTKTPLGVIRWCHFICKKGYRLKDFYPQYEICGKATNYRWSYELKGLLKPTERCIEGNSQPLPKPCTTPECFATAAYYMNKIDYSVNPCDNFFDFACGRWNKESEIPASKTSYSTYSVIRDRVNLQLAELLKQPTDPTDSTAVAKAKIFYKSCINTDVIDKEGSEPLLKFLQGDLSWPIIDPKWSPNHFDFESTVAALRGKCNNNYIMTIDVGTHDGKYVLEILKGRLLLPFSFYLNENLEAKLDAYYMLMYDAAVMLGASPEQALLDVALMRNFEVKLARYKKHSFSFGQVMTIEKLQNIVPQINWLKMFKLMITTPSISSNTSVIVWSESYLKQFAKLVKNTSKRVVQNYMVWNVVKYRINNLDSRFQSRILQYENEMYGVKAMTSRKVKCSQELMVSMKAATSKMFVDKYFKQAKKTTAKEMFDFIREGFIELLDSEVDWMDQHTKSYAKKKAKAIKPYIGFNPHLFENMTYLNESVQKLVITKSDYFGNYVRLLEKTAQAYFSKLGQNHDTSEYSFDVRATMVNAFYNTRHNSMVLPGGELQYPLYWGANYPRVLNFGAIGTILGHELTHGFDIVGRKFDLHGNIRNWWTYASLQEFKYRVGCLKDQYDNFYWNAAKENLDGKKDLAENIADNGGIRESFAGYKLWLKSKKILSEPVQPATGFTNEQMFFVAFANDRCSHFTHGGAVGDLHSNVHSPGRFRVIGSLQNFEMFSEAFNCPAGSYMNPRNKCIIW